MKTILVTHPRHIFLSDNEIPGIPVESKIKENDQQFSYKNQRTLIKLPNVNND